MCRFVLNMSRVSQHHCSETRVYGKTEVDEAKTVRGLHLRQIRGLVGTFGGFFRCGPEVFSPQLVRAKAPLAQIRLFRGILQYASMFSSEPSSCHCQSSLH